MNERRSQPRFVDTELVIVSCEKHSTTLKQLGNVEDVSQDGLGVIVDHALPVGSPVTISYGDSYLEGELTGVVRHYSLRRDGHFIGIEFAAGSKDSSLHFHPDLLTPAS